MDYTFFERQLVQRMLAQDKVISKRFAELINSASPLLAKWKPLPAADAWIRNKRIEKELDKILKSFATDLEAWINSEQAAAWELSSVKNDELVASFTNGLALNNQVLLGMNARNLDALKAFQKRKIDGMGLSDKVWNLSVQTKTQLEFYLESGISVGRSAEEISKDIRQLLNDPEKIFHRVRNEDGKLVPSKPMKDYHPGRGVYRSSYKNALRLAATETNMAYRMADHERWQGLDFVTGYEVKLSGSHPRVDICDNMKGEYPKDFVFRGWHPGCLCFKVPILMSQDDFISSLDDDSGVAINRVKAMPSDAKKYVTDNWDRFADYKNQPYWIRDNFKNGKPKLKLIKTR